MKQILTIRNGQPRLVLFFAGWGADERLFSHIPSEGSDRMVCYDYRSMSFDSTLLAPYREISVVAWSMGVWAACQVVPRLPQLPVAESIAINGTPWPIDAHRGIPPATFEATLSRLDDRNLWKFQRRICGTAEAHKAFLKHAPQRPVEELGEELARLRQSVAASAGTAFQWSKAVIGTNDAIFPPDNQRAAWLGNARETCEAQAFHYEEALFRQYLK